MRKGVSLPTVMAILAVVISAMFIGISSDLVLKPEQYIRSNSVFLMSERVSSAVYAMDSMERAEMQLDLEDKYSFERVQGDDLIYIRYSKGESDSAEQGEKKDPVEPGVHYTSEKGVAEKICVTKNPGSSPRIEMGRC